MRLNENFSTNTMPGHPHYKRPSQHAQLHICRLLTSGPNLQLQVLNKHQFIMKIAFVVAVLCLFAVCSASPSPLAKTQWHLRAPARGCVEVLHRFGGNEFRTYACDGAQGTFLKHAGAILHCSYFVAMIVLLITLSTIFLLCRILYFLTTC